MKYHVYRRCHGELHLLDFHPIRLNAEVAHVFTDAELRARDERIIRAALEHAGVEDDAVKRRWDTCDHVHIIAAAEADQ